MARAMKALMKKPKAAKSPKTVGIGKGSKTKPKKKASPVKATKASPVKKTNASQKVCVEYWLSVGGTAGAEAPEVVNRRPGRTRDRQQVVKNFSSPLGGEDQQEGADHPQGR